TYLFQSKSNLEKLLQTKSASCRSFGYLQKIASAYVRHAIDLGICFLCYANSLYRFISFTVVYWCQCVFFTLYLPINRLFVDLQKISSARFASLSSRFRCLLLFLHLSQRGF